MPKLQGMLIDLGGYGVNDITILGVSEVNFSFILPALCFVYITLFGLKTSNV
jgi:FHS family L-fucose permease-like MFS transporter